MNSQASHPFSSDTNRETIQENPTNLINHNQDITKKAMEKFQGLILKLAETHPNEPLNPATKTHVQNRLNQYFSQYKNPDHPPYSAMIERALRELNEKGGSTEESISQFLKKEYHDLPFAHSALLKHHLGKLCEFGDIVLICCNRYMLAEANPSLNLGSKSKKKSSKKKQNRKQENGEKVGGTEKCLKSSACEQELIDKKKYIEEKQVERKETRRLQSCDNGENGVYGLQEEQQNGDETPERPPGFEFVGVEKLSDQEEGNSNNLNKELKDNLLIDVAQTEELSEWKRVEGRLIRCSGSLPRSDEVTMISAEFGTVSEDHYSLQEISEVERLQDQDQENTMDFDPVNGQQKQQFELLKEDVVLAETKNQGFRIYGRKGKAKSRRRSKMC